MSTNKEIFGDPTISCLVMLVDGNYSLVDGNYVLMSPIASQAFEESQNFSLVRKWKELKEHLCMPSRYSNLADIGLISFLPWVGNFAFQLYTKKDVSPLNLFVNNLPFSSGFMAAGLPISSFACKLGLHKNPRFLPYVSTIPLIEYVVTRHFMPQGPPTEEMSLTTKLLSGIALGSLESSSRPSAPMGILAPIRKNTSLLNFITTIPNYTPNRDANLSIHGFALFTQAPVWEEYVKSLHFLVPTGFGLLEHYSYIARGVPSDAMTRVVMHNIVSLPSTICRIYGIQNRFVTTLCYGLSMFIHASNNLSAFVEMIQQDMLTESPPIPLDEPPDAPTLGESSGAGIP